MNQAALAIPHRARYFSDLLRELVVRDLKIRYKRSVIGLAWSLVTPLLQLAVLSFAFRLVIRLDVENFTLFLFIGLLAWSWFQSSLHMSSASIVDSRELLKQPGFPAAVLPVATVTTNLVHFLLAFVALLPFLLFAGGASLSWTVLLLPLVMAVQFVLILSIAYFFATLNVNFRDTQHLVGVLLMLGFYLTPIFYQAEKVPHPFQAAYQLNPLVHILGAYRAILMDGALPNLALLALVCFASCLLLLVTLRQFTRASSRFVEEL